MRDNAEAAHIRLDQSTINALNALINESVVTGTRYTTERMAEVDSERDVVVEKAVSKFDTSVGDALVAYRHTSPEIFEVAHAAK